jgi:hypothetical protein
MTSRLRSAPRQRQFGVAFAVIAASLAAAAPPAGAVVTIGSDLSPDPNAGVVGSNAAHTIATVSLPGGTVNSPIDGVVVRWRVRADGADAGGNPVRLKVIRPAEGGEYSGINTSATQTITSTANPTTFTFPTQQPISAGDLIALDISAPAFPLIIQFLPEQPGLHVALWEPPLLDGQERSPNSDPFAFDWGENLYNADVEPDCDQDGFGDETQDSDISSCSPAPPSEADRTLTLDANKNKVKKGQRVRFSGQIDAPQNEAGCEPDQTVELQRKKKKAPDSAFETFASLQSGNTGKFTSVLVAKKTRVYRAVVPETATCDGQVSNTEKVKIKKKK